MKTDVIVVSSRGARMEAALAEIDKIAVYKNLSAKNALHLRLLTEEMMGMMRSITGQTEGKFWVEDNDGVYELHLKVETRMTSEKRDRLLAASSSGKNESARGLMGRLRDFFDRSADEDLAGFTNPILLTGGMEYSSSAALDWEWSMLRYEESLTEGVERRDVQAQEAWDELEKSVVAHVADDIKVSIRGTSVEMIIFKKLA